MSPWKERFRKRSPQSSPDISDANDVRGMLDEDASTVDPDQDLTIKKASPKEALRYVFQQLKAGTPPHDLQADLVRRGFSKEIADGYIDLVLRTMFKGG